MAKKINESELEIVDSNNETTETSSEIDWETDVVDKSNILSASKLIAPISLKFLDKGMKKSFTNKKGSFNTFDFNVIDLESENKDEIILRITSSRLMNMIKELILKKVLMNKSYILTRVIPNRMDMTQNYYVLELLK